MKKCKGCSSFLKKEIQMTERQIFEWGNILNIAIAQGNDYLAKVTADALTGYVKDYLDLMNGRISPGVFKFFKNCMENYEATFSWKRENPEDYLRAQIKEYKGWIKRNKEKARGRRRKKRNGCGFCKKK